MNKFINKIITQFSEWEHRVKNARFISLVKNTRVFRFSCKYRIHLLSSFTAMLTIIAVLIIISPMISGSEKLTPSSESNISLQNNLSDSKLNPSPSPSPTPTSTPTPTPTPDPTLRFGDENERVQKLQERLMDLNYMDLDESTQYYGPATQNAVSLFQRQHELAQDGVAGPITLDMINSPDAKKYTLIEGTRGSDVDSLQRQLVDLGYLSKATGYYGSETVSAVIAFQERNGLSVDGKTGEQTLSLIYSPNAKQSASKVQAELRKGNINEFIAAAEKQLGDPYVLGAVGPDKFDCSGLVYYCLKEAGSSRSRYNAAGYAQVTDWEKITSMDNMQIGDIIFFSTNGKAVGHVGIYIGGGMMIDASSSSNAVVKRSCRTDFWERNFVSARRPW
ncbi:MAG TPA: CHAP domain-containing protein [Clostridiaceae bacterium]|nr:CHAP domain-containing protein [Clostridiaceae bacterium]